MDLSETAAERAFRDRVMKGHPFGRALIRLYYHASPRFADQLRGHPAWRAVARHMVAPFVMAAHAWRVSGGK